jgi:MFS family permease
MRKRWKYIRDVCVITASIGTRRGSRKTPRDDTSRPAGARPSQRSQRALDWVNFFIADVETAFGPFVALFLATHDWTQGNIGTAITINSLVALAVQVPAGWLIDHSHHKRGIIAGGLVCLGGGSLVVAFFPSFLPVVLAEALYGSAGATIRTAIAAVAIGLVGHKALHTRTGRNQRFLSLGNVLTAAVMGVLGQYVSPQAPFFVAAALCLPAGIALFMIRGKEIDYARARQSVGRKEERPAQWREIFRNKSLRVFALCLLLFQFADASLMPLATERLTADHKPASVLVTSGFVIVQQVVTVLLAGWVAGKADRSGRKQLLVAAFAVECFRCLMFAMNLGPWFLVGMQSFAGLTAVVIGIMMPRVVADLTKQSGRYNFSLGAVTMMGSIGAAASTLVSGFVAQWFGFAPAFMMLTIVAAGAAALMWFAFPETVESARTAEDIFAG